MFITLAFFDGVVPELFDSPAAYRHAFRISKSVPPEAPSPLRGITLPFQVTPATPVPLFVAAPIVPATWVPWKELFL